MTVTEQRKSTKVTKNNLGKYVMALAIVHNALIEADSIYEDSLKALKEGKITPHEVLSKITHEIDKILLNTKIISQIDKSNTYASFIEEYREKLGLK